MIGDYKHLRLWSKSYKIVIKFTCTLVLQFIVVDISRVISRFIRIWRHSASPSANRGVMPSHACSETLSVCEGQAHYTSTAVIYGDTWSIWCRWTKIFCLFSSGETFCHEWLYHGNVDYYLSASWNDCAGYVCVAMCLLSARWCLLSWPGQTILTAEWQDGQALALAGPGSADTPQPPLVTPCLVVPTPATRHPYLPSIFSHSGVTKM